MLARSCLLTAAMWLTSGVLFAAEAEPAPAPSETPLKTEQPKSEPTKPEASKTEASKTETPKPEAPKPGPAAAEYQKVLADWKALLAELTTLKVKYKTAAKDERTAMLKQWDGLIAKGDAMEPQLLQAAEKAFAEAPNADKELRDLLLAAVVQDVLSDNYEPALQRAKMLEETKCDDKRIYTLAGIAAAMAADYDAAEKYLKTAQEKKVPLSISPKERETTDNMVAEFLKNPAAWKKAWENEQKIRAAEAKADDLPRVLLKTSKGDIEIELFENEAPNTVASFISLIEKKFYDGLSFHRVLHGFMAQGGDPKGDGSGGPGYTIADECRQPNHRLHFRGSLSMAKSMAPDSGGSQFFLTYIPTKFLDGQHTVFGRVVKGFDVLAKLRQRDPDGATADAVPDKIIKATVLRKRDHEYAPKTGADK